MWSFSDDLVSLVLGQSDFDHVQMRCSVSGDLRCVSNSVTHAYIIMLIHKIGGCLYLMVCTVWLDFSWGNVAMYGLAFKLC